MEESSDGQGRWGQGEKGWPSSWNCGFLFESFLQVLFFFFQTSLNTWAWSWGQCFKALRILYRPISKSEWQFTKIRSVSLYSSVFCFCLRATVISLPPPPLLPPTWYSIPRKTHSQSHLFCLKKKKRDCANFFQSRHSWHGLHWSRGS